MDPIADVTRRAFLQDFGMGIGAAALGSLLGPAGAGRLVGSGRQGWQGRQVAPRAKSVIYLHMAGSPSPLDMFDPKPKLVELNGEPCPESLFGKERFAFIRGTPKMLGSPYRFVRHGATGTSLCELLPHLGRVVDELTIVKSVHTDQFNHAPAQMLLYTGSPRLGRPSMGSWVTWGLGSDNKDLPGFVVLVSGGKVPSAGRSVWGSGFLPTIYQGVELRSQGEPVLYLSDPAGIDRAGRRRSLDALRDLNELQRRTARDPEIDTRIAQYELAFRMQMSVPEIADISREDESTLAMYGARPGGRSFANNCLLARRLVEHGVRFVQLYDWGWDLHGTAPHDDLMHQFPQKCQETDRPIAALLTDLRRRGLLDQTLVVWSGEFGRTPMNEERNGSKLLGRDHHPHSFTVWMAGGGTKRGLSWGSTDELGYHIAEHPVHVHDLQATILYLLGVDHEALTYKFQGRDFRLTDVAGRVVDELLA